MINRIFLSVTISVLTFCTQAQDTIFNKYQTAFGALTKEIKTPTKQSFKHSVFWVENTFYDSSLDKETFDTYIKDLTALAKTWLHFNPIPQYTSPDSTSFGLNMAIYKVLMDSIKIITPSKTYYTIPYRYDFNDFFGKNDWSNMFVTKLLTSHQGNCHSLPFLYKILADELGATCWLSLAPNHIYIKNRNQRFDWYNTELTSGSFPTDAWILTSGYIPLDAVRNGIYLDTLSNQQAIALCVLDLAKAYEHQIHNYYDGFILQCCELVLQYHPQNVQALLLKAETLKQVFLHERKIKYPKPTITFKEMENYYVKLFELGYREMPERMYLNWLRSITNDKLKFENKQLKETLRTP